MRPSASVTPLTVHEDPSATLTVARVTGTSFAGRPRVVSSTCVVMGDRPMCPGD